MAQKRRTFSAEFKLDTVIEGLRGEKSVAQICRERDINETLYYKWQQTFRERAANVFVDQRGSAERYSQEAQRVAELERMVGRLAMEVEILKKAKTWLDTQRARNGQ
jgi:transposase-like protein